MVDPQPYDPDQEPITDEEWEEMQEQKKREANTPAKPRREPQP